MGQITESMKAGVLFFIKQEQSKRFNAVRNVESLWRRFHGELWKDETMKRSQMIKDLRLK